MKKFIHFLISITIAMQIFPVFASADALYDEPNDTLFFRQWYYDAVKAYTYRNNGIDGKGVKVGVIDSGLTKNFKTFHDFDEVYIETGINVCALIDNNTEKLYNTEDSGHHGTQVASVICAKDDNDYGIAGLTDGCTVIPYKVEDFDCSTLANSEYSLLVAIELAYKDDCNVVNISQVTNGQNPTLYEQAVKKAIQNGMIIIAGAGNDGKNGSPIKYPAACDNVIGVGGLEPDCNTEKADVDLDETIGKDLKYNTFPKETIRNLADNDYSKYVTSTANESVFVSAPGMNITVPCLTDRTTQEWTNTGGTSFATPIVAAAAIGAKQMRPYIDVDMFKEILIATSTDLDADGYDINTGYGMVNFEKIYEYVSQMPETAPERTPNVQVDYENGKLTNFCPNREYSVNGVNIGTPEYDNKITGINNNKGGFMDIPEEWYGTTIEIVKLASSDAYTDSEPQLLEIPALPEATATPTATPTIKPTIKPTVTPTPTPTPTPTAEPTETPVISFLPTIDYENERIIGLDITKEYTVNGEDVTLNDDFSLPIKEEWYGQTITVAIKGTNEAKTLTVEFPDKQYELETAIEYKDGICTYSAVNNTIWTINATGIIAVYGQNGVLKHLETVGSIPAEGINKKLNFTLTDGDMVKWLVWDSLNTMKPKDKVKLSEYTMTNK